jgi:hypothetical protein
MLHSGETAKEQAEMLEMDQSDHEEVKVGRLLIDSLHEV